MSDLWPHQRTGIDATLAAIDEGWRRILLTSPTGGGKTRIMEELIDIWTAAGLRTVLYTNRRLLTEQTSNRLSAARIDHGVRAAGWKGDDFQLVQIASIQTEHSRVVKKGSWPLYDADRALVDEAHLQANDMAMGILDRHGDEGASIVGVTATPLGLGHAYDRLIVAGTNSQLRECGALVPCRHYGPDEPDLREIRKVPLGEELSENQVKKLIMTQGIFGRVMEWYQRLNPEQKPTLLFAPGVAESRWFAEQFKGAGISAAHIDGNEVWVNGKSYRSDRQARADVLEGSKDGTIKVLCNRFVLREGIDCPWLAHGIFATVFGSLQSYLQSGGRLLRAYPSLEYVTIQDHGGNYWRHGSLNDDREWRLHDDARIVAARREDLLRQKKAAEPWRCPKCGMVLRGPVCKQAWGGCGWEAPVGTKRSRPVVQSDGSMKEMKGDIFRRRATCTRPDGPAIWKRMYFRSKTDKGSRTFRAAFALFAQENNWQWPDPRWPYMPRNPEDVYRLVKDVPMADLIPE